MMWHPVFQQLFQFQTLITEKVIHLKKKSKPISVTENTNTIDSNCIFKKTVLFLRERKKKKKRKRKKGADKNLNKMKKSKEKKKGKP